MPKCPHTIRITADNPAVVVCQACGATMPATTIAYKPKYSFTQVQHGTILRRLQDGATAFLQGEAGDNFMVDIAAMQEAEYPYGPFSCYAEHCDYIISQFDDIMQTGE